MGKLRLRRELSTALRPNGKDIGRGPGAGGRGTVLEGVGARPYRVFTGI